MLLENSELTAKSDDFKLHLCFGHEMCSEKIVYNLKDVHLNNNSEYIYLHCNLPDGKSKEIFREDRK